MPSTYSPNLRLELIANGEQPGIWGDTTNRNIGTLLEQAISGVTNIVLADANVTLTAVSGATDQARSMILNVTGTASAQRDIICPAVPKLYVVRNATSGGQSILVRTTAGAGVAVANGRSSVLFSDGTAMYDASTSLAAGTSLTNPVITGGSATGTALTNCTYSGNVIASNPKFSALVSTSVVINQTTYSTIIFNSEEFDTASAYNTSTGVFTAPVAGTYRFDALLRFSGTRSNTLPAPNVTVALRRNAVIRTVVNPTMTPDPAFNTGSDNAYDVTVTFSRTLPLSANDVIDLQTYGATSSTIVLVGGAAFNSFSGVLLV